MEKYCASCKNRHGKTDRRGITHCAKLFPNAERECIACGHIRWQPDDAEGTEQQLQPDSGQKPVAG